MGGSSSSSSSSSTTNQTDERIAAEDSIVADDGATINIDIEDTTPELLALVTEAGERVINFSEKSFEFANSAQEAQLEALNRAFDATPAGGTDLARTIVTWGLVAGAATVAIQHSDKLANIVREFRK